MAVKDTESPRATLRLYISGRYGSRWHIAAHEPSGYGVRALCGVSWREGNYVSYREPKRDDGTDILLCRRCERS